jgi:predicted nucleic acid-binding protein
VLYLDSSAIVKLVRPQPETPGLVSEIRRDPQAVSSALAWTEVLRAAGRLRLGARRAQHVMGGIALVPIDDGILRAAAALPPQALRTLDAIHVATALSLVGDIAAMITYDERQAAAAVASGLEVRSP